MALSKNIFLKGIEAFEQAFCEYTGIKHCVALSSGTAAMHLALKELGVGPGDEVIGSTLTLKDVPGIEFMPEAFYGKCNRWLTVILINPEEFGVDYQSIQQALENENIESRPVWKPMHMQPVFQGHRAEGIEHRAEERGQRSEIRDQRSARKSDNRLQTSDVRPQIPNRGWRGERGIV